MPTYYWTNADGNGNLDDPNNWGSAQLPDSGDDVFFLAIGNGALTGEANFKHGYMYGDFDLYGSLVSSKDIALMGALAVPGGTIQCSTLQIGYGTGSGSVILNNGATVTAGSINIGWTSDTNNGDLTVNSATVTADSISIGFSANSTNGLTVENNANVTVTTNVTVNYGGGMTNYLTVDDAILTCGTLDIGSGSTGNGTVLIENGAKVTTSDLVLDQSSGTTAATITGAGTIVTVGSKGFAIASDLTVSDGAQVNTSSSISVIGTLFVENGASIETTSSIVVQPFYPLAASPGTALIIESGATVTAATVGINGGPGSVLVEGSGAKLDANTIDVAYAVEPIQGSLNVMSGGQVQITDELSIGSPSFGDQFGTPADFGTGTVTVDGPGSLLDANNMTVGGAQPAAGNNGQNGDWSYFGGVGTLTVSNSAKVIVGDTLNVADVGPLGNYSTDISVLSGGSIEVGGNFGAPTGTLQIDSGGHLVGHGLIASNIADLGTVEAQNGVLIIQGSVIGDGGALIDQNCTLELDGACASNTTIAFNAGYETTLKLDEIDAFSGKVITFEQGDVIDLTNVSCSQSAPIYATYTISNNVLSLSTGATITVSGLLDPVPTFGIKPDGNGGSDIETTSLQTLIKIADDSYGMDPGKTANPLYNTIPVRGGDVYNLIGQKVDNGFEALAYQDTTGSENSDPNIVIVFRGTDQGDGFLTSLKNWTANGSVASGKANPMFEQYISDAAKFVASIYGGDPDALITLDGHSLGGAIAQLVGKASNFATAAFNAWGAGALYSQLLPELQPVINLGFGGTDINYRIAGDVVSLLGTPIGQTYTIAGPIGPTPSLGQIVTNFLSDHKLSAFTNIPTYSTAIPLTNASAYTETQIADAAEAALSVSAQIIKLSPIGLVISFLGNVLSGALNLFDPNPGTSYVFTEDPGSPNFASIILPNENGVASYQVRYETGTSWSAFQQLLPGVTQLLPDGVNGIEFDPVDSSGQPVVLPGGFQFAASFASSGQFSGTLSITGTGPVAQPVTAPVTLVVQKNAGPVAINIPMPTDAAYPNADNLAVNVTSLPSNGTVFLSDGSTPVTVGEELTTTQLTTLMFQPTHDLAGKSSVFDYAVADPDFATTAGTVTLAIAGTGPGATVSSLSVITDTGGTLVNAGHVVTIMMTTSASVTVTGTPVLQLNDNEVAAYAGGSGTSTLSFTYTVQPGDNASDLQVTGLALLNGAGIVDGNHNSLSGPLTGDFGIQVDTTPPTITITSPGGAINNPNVTVSGTVAGVEAGSQVTISDGSTFVAITALGADGTWSASVTLAGNGTHTLTAQDTDVAGNTGTSNAVTYTLNAPAPSAVTDLYITPQGTALTVSAASGVLANDTDPNGLTLSATLDQTTAHGTLTLNADGSFSYTPQAGFVGTDSFTYTASDADLSSAPTTASIVVGSLNALTSPEQLLTELYVGYYDRAPDVPGLNYWLDNYNTPPAQSPGGVNLFYQNLGQAAASFADPHQTETVTLYPFLADPGAASYSDVVTFVDAAYGNLFNRTADTLGEEYWATSIAKSLGIAVPTFGIAGIDNDLPVTAANALLALINGAVSNDAQTIANKVTAGLYYYDMLAANNVAATQASAHAAFAGVTDDPATVLASEAVTNAFVQAALHPSAANAAIATVGILDSAQSFQAAA